MEDQAVLPPDADILYFAYGSCLHHASLSASLGLEVGPRFLGPARLSGYRLRFSDASVTEAVCFATIPPEPGAQTEGGLFRKRCIYPMFQ
ncbi:gamma-glutamylcyclotransferase [Rhodobacter capsulatus]|uniref:Gamma-glutamylcyclotransferase n=1 Tax=Rhodobacter capsulatus TaxID=1061 RepID=A0A4U1K011_RHOCA|nr:gamma-glutamylcyclotransferase family protein [Rhodobacter capsulatus]TKD25132.1 gamma-glutamylcyclotransferase [Rhodobacter capsulatus]